MAKFMWMHDIKIAYSLKTIAEDCFKVSKPGGAVNYRQTSSTKS